MGGVYRGRSYSGAGPGYGSSSSTPISPSTGWHEKVIQQEKEKILSLDESNICTFEQKKLELQNLEQTRALDNGTKTLLLMATERDAKRRKIGAPNEELKKTSPNITSNASPPMGDMLSPVVVSMEIQQQLEENKRLRNEIKKVRMQGMQGNMTQVQMQGNTTKAKMIIIEDDRLQKAKETDLVQENAY